MASPFDARHRTHLRSTYTDTPPAAAAAPPAERQNALMRSQFPQYRPLSGDDARRFILDATIVLDTNVLFALYRVGATARDESIRALESVRDRLWVPHQIGLEFYRNVETVREELSGAYESSLVAVAALRDPTLKAFGTGWRHQESRRLVGETLSKAIEELHRNLATLRDTDLAIVGSEDELLERIELLLDGRVSVAPPPNVVRQRVEEFTSYRSPNRVPPGYRDARKSTDLLGAGDYLLWCELLDHASSSDGPVLLVTEDTKDDWYQRAHGKSSGPRPELIAEFAHHSPHGYHQVTFERFLHLVKQHLGTVVSEETVDEVADAARETVIEDHLETLLGSAASLSELYGTSAMRAIVEEASAALASANTPVVRRIIEEASVGNTPAVRRMVEEASAAARLVAMQGGTDMASRSRTPLGEGGSRGQGTVESVDDATDGAQEGPTGVQPEEDDR